MNVLVNKSPLPGKLSHGQREANALTQSLSLGYDVLGKQYAGNTPLW